MASEAETQAQDWESKHRVKRLLSQFEKSTLPEPCTKALILPGSPDEEGICSEIEELVQAGFDYSQIVGVEIDSDIARRIRRAYYDLCIVVNDPIELFLLDAKSRYSYIHFDYCGHLSPSILNGFQNWLRVASDRIRIRITLFRPRKGPDQIGYEQGLGEQIALSLGRTMAGEDGHNRWHIPLATIDFSDPTVTLAAVGFLNAVYGMTSTDFLCGLFDPRQLAERPFHIANLKRFHYHDQIRWAMSTMWIDLERVERLNPTEEAYRLFSQLAYVPATFRR